MSTWYKRDMTAPQSLSRSVHEATQLRDAWYAVARSAEVGPSRPLERVIVGERIALYRSAAGVHALAARCPHRGANLADGRVSDGCLRCPYHGWAFDGGGQCVEVPSNPPGQRIPSDFAVPAFAALERDGFVWVCVGDPPQEPPALPMLADGSLTGFTIADVIDIPFDWWVENVLDVSHVAVAHGASYAAADARIGSFTVERWDDDRGYSASVELAQRYSFWARLLHHSVSHFAMRVRIEVWMPGTVVFHVELPGARKQVIVTLAAPVDGSRTRYYVIPLRNYYRFPGANLIGEHFTRKVLDEDIELGRRSLAPITLAVESPRSVAADAPSLEYLRLLRRWARRELGGSKYQEP